MKIAIVCYPTFGGSGVLATELGMSLCENGHEVHFIAYKKPVRLRLDNNNVFFHKVNVPDYPLFNFQPYELALSTKLVEVISKFGVELMHVHYAIPHAYAAYMAKKMLIEKNINVPIITTLHGTDITLVGNHPFYKTAVNFSINKSDVVTCVSESLKQDTIDQFDIDIDIKVVPNFIDISKYKKQQKICFSENENNNEKITIAHVSNFRAVKNVNNVVLAFNKISKKIPSKLIMIGEGPEKLKAEILCKSLSIDNDVSFLGNTNEVEKNLCHSDLFLLPSSTESFGLAALEAMASRVPVISSNAGGLPEINKHGVTGYLTNCNDIDSMTKYAFSILKNNKTLEVFKKNAFEKALNYDINIVVPMYEKIYENTLKSL